MGDRELSRREVLAGIAAVGGSGVVGATSGAIVQDDVTVPGGTVSAGAVDLRVETDGESGESRAGTIDVTLSADARSGNRTVTLVNEENPVYPWMRATCLGDDALSEALGMTLSYVGCEDGQESSVVASGESFTEFADDIVDGIVLDGRPETTEQHCLEEGGRLCLELSWILDEEFRGEFATGFSLEFLGQQCRHNDGDSNPFVPTPGCSP
ncbi:CoxS/CutS family dehydrogenase iron-sulfur subunit [Halorhabdus amylolytica]|uniref:hypothetical protein n=1 Tax=Halorhabdus amylolytica TaxID=2559573 RepID=UPI0010A9AC7B|nr:hypothetical protein [Halorhabdus amylolytica]